MLLGERLVRLGKITEDQLNEALTEQKNTSEFLGNILLRRAWIREDDLTEVLSEQFEMPFMKLKNEYLDWNLILTFSSTLVVEHKCVPFRKDEKGYTVAITNPLDAMAISEAEKLAQRGDRVSIVLVTPSQMHTVIREYQKRLSDKIKGLLG